MTRGRHDLAIVGSGSAGFAAAIAARQRGLDVVMIERDTVGGTCVNTGCVPSKALLAAAEARQAGLEARFPGIATAASSADWATLAVATGDLTGEMRTGRYVDLADEYGWPILSGTAGFAGTPDDPVLRVGLADGGTTCVQARHYVVATGAAPWAPPVPGLAGSGYLTSTTAMRLDRLPASMVVLGGNAVGLEQAQLFAHLGVRVTVVEARDRVAPFEEPEISAELERLLRAGGIDVRTGATVSRVRREGTSCHLAVEDAAGTTTLAAERLLVATGRRPVTGHLGLAAVGVTTGGRGEVVVDDRLRTANPRIWAAGDVTGGPQFVYVAGAHGGLVVANAFADADRAVDYRVLPRVTFTSPAIASVGSTAVAAVTAGHRVECRVLPLDQVPRAVVNRRTGGVAKLVADAVDGRLLGVHVLADGAGDVIAGAGYALAAGMSVRQLADAWCPYLTMAESLKLAAQAFTVDVSKLSCCAA